MDDGFLRLSRKFFSNELWKEAREFSECEAWLDLIQSARFEATDKAYSELIGGREISYSRGQYPASISFLTKRWKWSDKKVRYFLAKLKKKGMITVDNKQGMNVITLCNYDEYNPVKGKNKGIDNDVGMNEINTSLGKLKGELLEAIEKMGQARGRKKKKEEELDSNNIPPTPPEGDDPPQKPRSRNLKKELSLNAKARQVFEAYYKLTFDADYYWSAKDAGNMSKLLDKLKYQRAQRKLPNEDDDVLNALSAFLGTINDGWILDNFSVANINSKFNELRAKAINKQHGNSNKNSGTHSADDDEELMRHVAAGIARGYYERQRGESGNGGKSVSG